MLAGHEFLIRLPTSLWDECSQFACPEAMSTVRCYNRGPQRVHVAVPKDEISSFFLAVAAAVDMAQLPSERKRWTRWLSIELDQVATFHGVELVEAARRMLAP